MPDLVAIPCQFMTSYDNTASVGMQLSMNCIILIWKSVAKVPVVSGLYVVEELEEIKVNANQPKSPEEDEWWSSSESAKVV